MRATFLKVKQAMSMVILAGCATPEDPDPPLPEPGSEEMVVTMIGYEMTADTVAAFDRYLQRMPAEYQLIAWTIAVKLRPYLFATNTFLEMARRNKEIWSKLSEEEAKEAPRGESYKETLLRLSAEKLKE